MSNGLTPRQQARAENLARIKDLALAQLASGGAAELSLRAIARELNIVSSAIYRYYPGRDELITDLVIDAYDDLAEHLLAALETRRGPRRHWIDACLAMREWAIDQPHRFALIYGSAIPGYFAPEETIESAARVPACFFAAAPDAQAPAQSHPIGRELRRQLGVTAAAFDSDADAATVLAQVTAFAQIVGLLTLELNGHFVGGFEPADDLYAAVIEREADALGL